MSSMLGKSKITVDTTVLANGDSLAAYLTDAGGALITSSLIGGKQRLDANLDAEHNIGSAVGGTDANIGALVKDSSGNYALLNLDAGGNLKVTYSNPDGDAHAQNSAFTTGDFGDLPLAIRQDTSTVGASASGNYSYLQTWSEGGLKVVDIANSSILQQRISVATTATKLPTTPLSSRKSLLVQNAGSASIWVGSSSVTSSGATTGIEVPKGSFIELDIGPAVDVYGIASGSAVNANILEMGG